MGAIRKNAVGTIRHAGSPRPVTTWSRNNPYSATVLENRLLTGSDSEKETRHIELDLGDSGITYLPGDSAGILPINACDAVDLVLERLQLTGAEPVTDFYGKPLDLRQALSSWLMIGKLSGSTLKAWAKHTGNPELSDIAANREKLDAYLWGREFLDLLEHAPGKLEDPQQLFKILPRLAPRLYSISSSQALLGTQIDLSIRVVKYETHGRDRFGVCSTHVGERTPKGEQAPHLHPQQPALPPPRRPRRARHHGRPRHRRRPLPRLPPAQTGRSRPLAHVALLRRPARLPGLPL